MTADRPDSPGRPSPRRVTMRDVARVAGVSQPLVSIVFRDAPGASEETRAHVLAVAAELGYRRDERARLLRQGRSRLLGIAFEPVQPFHGEILDGLHTAAQERGYDVVLSAVTPHRAEDAAVEALLRDRCEALVLLGSALPQARLEDLSASLPVVSVTRAFDTQAFDSVATDDYRGAALAVEHLVALGHRRIVYIDADREAGGARRRTGYQDTMAAAGLGEQMLIERGGASEAEGAAAVSRLLAQDSPPTAVLAFNDRCAVGVISQARVLGRSVPGNLSVVGFDDSEQASLPYIDLTTLAQDPRLLAGTAVDLTVRRLEAAATDTPVGGEHVVLPAQLVTRTSTAPVTAAP
ncbi:LacI family DNA-binding transcriptional regulator [Kocuria sediminis]|uniref:LacI family DNA-binding transcriptional regulator n=1 Tax=Kocuria sediminis TaxID=1038857 RepID=A0A6N8GNH5_9MICC|nr:LacI family DNA-binding transcriptional regulator [Kocuria sediminis]MUN64631.1 LacI family DNA-binding transcriptional regulator [Kocuria sediminis]